MPTLPAKMPPIVSADLDRYWGPVTASIDWCELNYATTPYIAEFYNTVSSLCIVLAGCIGLAMVCPLRYKVAFACIAVVGLGSAMFHMTLLKQWQASDEVPMLYSALSYLYILLVQDRLGAKQSRYVAIAMVCYSVFTTLLVTLTTGPLQFYLFHASFAPTELYCLYRVYYKKSKYTRIGFTAYSVALVCWFCDFWTCETVQFHAL